MTIPPAMWEDVRASYDTPGRAYHTFDHVLEVMDRWRDVERDVGWERPLETSVAVLYHDAVYVPGRHDNEADSARRMREVVARLHPDVDCARVEELILLTARHGKLTPADVDAEAARFLDCDMAILGAAPERFAEYERQIAIEYSALPPELYAAGRRRFLDGVLASPRIFLSDYFHQRLDGAARKNLRPALFPHDKWRRPASVR
jgi:predicted metal-dependent HD superfamily phosphohydrolase